MKDQEKQLGALLKTLRQQSGYTTEDWAAIFNIHPATIARIERGQELPQEFLVPLIKWIVQSPPPTAPLLPKAVPTVLGNIELKTSKLHQLEQALRLQAHMMQRTKDNVKTHARHVQYYEQLIDGYRATIAELEQKQAPAPQRKPRAPHRSRKWAWGLVSVMAGGLFGYFLEAGAPQSPLVARARPALRPGDWAHQVRVMAPRAPKAGAPLPPPRVAALTRLAPPKAVVQSKAAKPRSPVVGVNRGLTHLLAHHTERNNHLIDKYASPQGKTILRFNNPDQKRMVIVMNNHRQEEIHRDTIQTKHHLLDTEKLRPGVYHYWIYFGQDKNYTHTGKVRIDLQK